MDYWDDYSEYDNTAEELKASLLVSVKQEVKDKIEKLQRENAELKEKQKNLTLLEQEVSRKTSQLDRDIRNAERTVKNAKAKELFKEIAETKYMLTNKSFTKDKCDKCNEKRKLTFTYPSGKVGEETCDVCGSTDYRAVVTEALGVSIDVRSGELIVWYKPYKYWDDDEYSSMSGEVKKPYTGQDFTEMDKSRYSYIFTDKSDAQKYADYLNEKR